MTQYFVVGASWGGTEDCSTTFLEEGTWWCFSKDAKNSTENNSGHSVENMKKRMMTIKAGDRLAMKKMHEGSKSILVRRLGIVNRCLTYPKKHLHKSTTCVASVFVAADLLVISHQTTSFLVLPGIASMPSVS
jgi:hypothetical protein